MLTASLLLITAVIGGALFTFFFYRSASLAARLCMGACIGLAVMATVGFLLALWLGLGYATLNLSAAILLLPLLLLLDGERRAFIVRALRPSASARNGSGKSIGYLAF